MSVINVRYKHVFIHVPKTAGTSMEEEPFVGGRSHEAAQHLLERLTKVGLDPHDFFWWGFVRHPFDRFLSWWGHLNTPTCGDVDFEGSLAWAWKGKSVDDFLNWAAQDEEGLKLFDNIIHLVPQYQFFRFSENNTPEVFIGRYERLEEDWDLVCARLGESPRKLPVKRRSNRSREFRRALSEESRARLYWLYKRDFDDFQYGT